MSQAGSFRVRALTYTRGQWMQDKAKELQHTVATLPVPVWPGDSLGGGHEWGDEEPGMGTRGRVVVLSSGTSGCVKA